MEGGRQEGAREEGKEDGGEEGCGMKGGVEERRKEGRKGGREGGREGISLYQLPTGTMVVQCYAVFCLLNQCNCSTFPFILLLCELLSVFTDY